jgi:hypothetical protein
MFAAGQAGLEQRPLDQLVAPDQRPILARLLEKVGRGPTAEPDQVVSTERMNALMRQFHQREESRARERQKRAISSSPADDDREPARKASRKNAATATDEGSDGEALPRSGA